jgi:hypothetical protein
MLMLDEQQLSPYCFSAVAVGLSFVSVDRFWYTETDGNFRQHEGVSVNWVGDFGFHSRHRLVVAYGNTLSYGEV